MLVASAERADPKLFKGDWEVQDPISKNNSLSCSLDPTQAQSASLQSVQRKQLLHSDSWVCWEGSTVGLPIIPTQCEFALQLKRSAAQVQLVAGSRRLSYKKTIKGSGTHCVDLLRSNLAAEQHSNEVLGVWEQQSNICDFSVLKTIKNLAAFTRSAWSCRACNTLHSCNSSLSWLSLWSLRSSTDSQANSIHKKCLISRSPSF